MLSMKIRLLGSIILGRMEEGVQTKSILESWKTTEIIFGDVQFYYNFLPPPPSGKLKIIFLAQYRQKTTIFEQYAWIDAIFDIFE